MEREGGDTGGCRERGDKGGRCGNIRRLQRVKGEIKKEEEGKEEDKGCGWRKER